jgi:hypothetical protein
MLVEGIRLQYAIYHPFSLLFFSRDLVGPFACLSASVALRPSTSNALPRRRADSRSSRLPFLLFSTSLLLVSCSRPCFGRLSHLRQQHGSLDLCINPSHLDFDNFSLNPLGPQLCRTKSHCVDTKLRAYTTVVLNPHIITGMTTYNLQEAIQSARTHITTVDKGMSGVNHGNPLPVLE